MPRFSYEWVEAERDEDAETHWTDELYAIYDAKLGFTEDRAIAWAYLRDEAERIVDALNSADIQASVTQSAKRRERYDLTDLLA